VTLSIGTDSQTVIDPWEELRSLEGNLRLAARRRLVLPSEPGLDGLARRLLEVGTAGGARSLGLDVGVLAPGRPADLCAIDLAHPSLVGAREDALLAAVVFGAASAAVSDSWVQGARVVRDSRHPLQDISARAYQALCRRMFA
jgi:formimidoylglutamate deiminase